MYGQHTAYDYDAQSWVTGPAAARILAKQYREELDILTGQRAAYLASKAERDADPAAYAAADPIPRRVDPVPYANRRLRAGTARPTESLESVQARADWRLAREHWRHYAEEHGIALSEYGPRLEDYYSWAVAWLTRAGLNPDEHNGKPYRYGSAWL